MGLGAAGCYAILPNTVRRLNLEVHAGEEGIRQAFNAIFFITLVLALVPFTYMCASPFTVRSHLCLVDVCIWRSS